MTPFTLKTQLAAKIAERPKDTSINGALVLVETTNGVRAIIVGEPNMPNTLARATTAVHSINPAPETHAPA